jgi:hypothetical protein
MFRLLCQRSLLNIANQGSVEDVPPYHREMVPSLIRLSHITELLSNFSLLVVWDWKISQWRGSKVVPQV